MICRLDHPRWGPRVSAASGQDSTAELESGAVILLPDLEFEVRWDERVHFSPSIAAAKNVSFDPSTGQVTGAAVANVPSANAESLTAMLRRFSDASGVLVDA